MKALEDNDCQLCKEVGLSVYGPIVCAASLRIPGVAAPHHKPSSSCPYRTIEAQSEYITQLEINISMRDAQAAEIAELKGREKELVEFVDMISQGTESPNMAIIAKNLLDKINKEKEDDRETE